MNRLLWTLALFVAASIGGCRRAIIIVPQTDRAYTERDTLYGFHRGNRVVISFRFDSVLRVDTVTRLDTLWRGGTRTIVRVDTLRRVDTVKVGAPVTLPSTGTPQTPIPTRIPTRTGSGTRPVPTTLPGTGTPTTGTPTTGTPTTGTPTTGNPGRVDTVVVARVDTVVVTRLDTVIVTLRDTVFRSDTIRVAGRRTLFVPPGQYPPEGQCRVWVHDLPPGRQADAGPCASLGNIPAGAFILFGGDAWDADYDWVTESQRGSVPPEIIAVSRRRRP